jgi:hypothetical protein
MDEQTFRMYRKNGKPYINGQTALLQLQAIHEGAGETCKEIKAYIESKGWVLPDEGELGERTWRKTESRPADSKWTQRLYDVGRQARNKGILIEEVGKAKTPEYRSWRPTERAEGVRRDLIAQLRERPYTNEKEFEFTKDFYNYVTMMKED